MTTASETDTRESEIQVVDDEGSASPPQRRTPVKRRRASERRVLSVAAVGLVFLVVVYAFFGAFVTHLWYETRQRALASSGLSLVKPKIGAPVGVLQVVQPFVLNTEIVEGDTAAQLRAGPGHVVGSPLPGSIGNSIIYGHEKQWGAPFRHLGAAIVGTQMYVRTAAGSLLVYRVIADTKTTAKGTVAYLGKSQDYRLTLITNAGGRFSDERTVVVAVSGTEGALSAPQAGTKAGPAKPGLLGAPLFELVAWLAATAFVALLLWRSQRRALLVAAMVPMVLAVLICGFLEMSLTLSPVA